MAIGLLHQKILFRSISWQYTTPLYPIIHGRRTTPYRSLWFYKPSIHLLFDQPTKQVVYVFIPENVSGNDRTITLTLTGAGSDNSAQKTLTLTQRPVKWLDPTGAGNPDKSWGCEFLLEGGPIDWGFCWEGITEEYITTQGNQTQVPPGQLKKVEQKMEATGFDLDLLHDPNYYINLVQTSNNNQGWLLQINYSKIGNIEIADSLYNGYSNTLELYNFDGISTLATIKDFVASYGNITYTQNSGQANIENTLDYAAMYALKRNRFYLLIRRKY